MDYTSERIETYMEEFDMCVPTEKLKKSERVIDSLVGLAYDFVFNRAN